MKRLPQLSVLILCLGASLAAAGQPRTWTEKAFVAQLNEAHKTFRTLTASLEYTKFTQAVEHKDTQTGRLYYRKNRRVKIEMLQPEPKEILFQGDKAEIYYPKMKQVQEFDLKKHREMVEQFLLLGFGTKGEELKESYLMTVLGETRLNGYPNAVLHVELTPKDERIRNQIHKIQLWFDMASWVPVQQKFFEVGGDYLLTRYSEVKVNTGIPASRLTLSAPDDVKRVKPRGGL